MIVILNDDCWCYIKLTLHIFNLFKNIIYNHYKSIALTCECVVYTLLVGSIINLGIIYLYNSTIVIIKLYILYTYHESWFHILIELLVKLIILMT